MEDKKGVTLSWLHSQTQREHKWILREGICHSQKSLNGEGLQRKSGVNGIRLGELGCRNRGLWG